MHNHYIINERIEFYPATSLLRELNNPENVVVLNSPASRCFLLLIQRIGSVVSQQEFMDEVWKKSKVLVSSNTFYQNISILRKGLKRIGIEEDIIVTIPRVGLTLDSQCQIRILDCVPEPIQHVISGGDDKKENNEQSGSQKYGTHHGWRTTLARRFKGAGKKTQSAFRKHHNHFGLKSFSVIVVIVVSSLYMMSLWGLFSFWQPADRLHSYVLVTRQGACRVMLSPILTTPDLKRNALKFAERFYTECNAYPWIYVDTLPQFTQVSVLRCPHQKGYAGMCVSDYFIEGNKP
ncbi:winged helix-turn-helix domain-containing protein [Erwinia sp. HR93]|uniref:winged helix-turn-helix domain-containing protein n=1 Tax=Erwinia sp. HR93 TaxID=3094840 RepID=UPI002ADEF0E4|nr:winged helix-turn-helix domain-containing protein [Erwinia sp. HR93]MEA1063272.1 winged helix-turn-helix domain-containing protein [Erwinia sp. HR93]